MSRTDYRPDIQGLRAIAVLAVILAHARIPGFSGGFVGVDVFFVISGFLITGLLLGQWQDTGRIRYFDFLVRRLKRLLPALLVMLVVVQVSSRLLLSSYEALMQTGSLIYAASWTSNLYFAFSEFNYFATLQDKDLYLHTWSLGVEEQFYLVWPGLLLIALSLAGSGSPLRTQLKRLLVLLLVVALVSFTLLIFWAGSDPLKHFYMMPGRAWQFALGAGVFLCSRLYTQPANKPRRFLLLVESCALLGLAMLFYSVVVFDEKLAYPGYYALLPSVGAALVLAAGSGLRTARASRLLSSKGLVWLGDRSYSLYLWHWPVLIIGGAYGLSSDGAGLALLFAITLALAMLSYRCIELPFWKGSFSLAAPGRTALGSAMAVVLLVAGSHKLVADIFTGIPSAVYSYDLRPNNGTPLGFGGRSSCDRWHFDAEVIPCELGSPDAPLTALLIGDSLGANWASVVPQIYTPPQWRVVLLTKSACAIVDVDYVYGPAGGVYQVCSDWRAASVDYIRELHPEIVFIANSAYYEFTESQWIEGTQSVVSNLAAATDFLVMIPGTPELSFDGPSCVRDPYSFTLRLKDSERMCEEKVASNRSAEVATYLESAGSAFENAYVINLSDLVCPGDRCAARSRDGILVFTDNKHLSTSFVRSTAPEVHRRLLEIGAAPEHFESLKLSSGL